MLAQQAGRYHEQPVNHALRRHFACVWVNQLSHASERPFVVVPDGCIDLQWIGGRWRVAGPDREPMIELLPAGSVVVGFRFQPAAARAWLGVSAAELCGRRPWLSDVLGRSGLATDNATAGLGAAPSIDAISGLLKRHGASMPLPNPEMSHAFRLLAEGSPRETEVVPRLMAELRMGERTLRRRFDDAFGYGPKTLDRILRFQRFLKIDRAHKHRNASKRAAAVGYADQSHLVKECRRLALCTPSELP